MNVFVLCAGRCGSVTFTRACEHATNFTAGHESRVKLLGEERLNFPANHIEADNRLAWLLGRLDARFGRDACYVHLRRDREQCARSHNRRWERGGMMHAYARALLRRRERRERHLDVCHDYLLTVEQNIELFLKDKPHRMEVQLEDLPETFPTFWRWIGAEGDLDAALRELETLHNAAKPKGLLRHFR